MENMMTSNPNTLELLKTLRERTGCGVMECRKALDAVGQDFNKALADLNEKAAVRAKKQADRDAPEGVIEMYSHGDGRIGVMLEINTETDFGAGSEPFRKLAHEIALQVAAVNPLYVRDEDIPAAVLAELAAEAEQSARAAGKPEGVIVRIVEGVLHKYKETNVLMRQTYIRDEAVTVAQLVEQTAGQIRENVVIRRFLRWEITPGEE